MQYNEHHHYHILLQINGQENHNKILHLSNKDIFCYNENKAFINDYILISGGLIYES